MAKNGHTFVSIVDTCKIERGIWNPYYYKKSQTNKYLADYVDIGKIGNSKKDISLSLFAPIEYRNIPKGDFLNFSLEENFSTKGRYSTVGEQILLFGTMRAYLGNVLITPKAEWIGKEKSVFYPVNSEFVRIVPKDNLLYFWWCYLKSPTFLNQMPTGGGGTRPRISIESLLHIPVSVSNKSVRAKINRKLSKLAEQAWKNYFQCRKIINQ